MEGLHAPLRGSVAVATELVTKGQLRGPGFRRVFPDIYLPANSPDRFAAQVRAILHQRAA
ncbi:MAG: hypothetical protein M3186_11790 [Actinomycetota bacterium]|nr:hypothetical protein [Actinomycetota bacterium]